MLFYKFTVFLHFSPAIFVLAQIWHLQDVITIDFFLSLCYNFDSKLRRFGAEGGSCMSRDFFSREIALIGEESFKKLHSSRVILFGIGGVGGYILEALVRAGVGYITVVDNDVVSESNINRQILATSENIGEKKTAAAVRRAKQINPDINIDAIDLFYLPETADKIDLSGYNYIIDAIDTVSAKIELAARAGALGIPFISCMGTANKVDTSGFRVCDIYKTSGCPLARVMRTECRKRNIPSFPVVFSDSPSLPCSLEENGRRIPASISFVPPIAAFVTVGEVVRELTK